MLGSPSAEVTATFGQPCHRKVAPGGSAWLIYSVTRTTDPGWMLSSATRALGRRGAQILDLIRSRAKHEEGDFAIREVLLVLHALVDGHEDVEFGLGQRQQHIILLPGPPHLLNGAAFMSDEMAF